MSNRAGSFNEKPSSSVLFCKIDRSRKLPSADTLSSPSSCCGTWQQRFCSSPSSSSSSRAPEVSPETRERNINYRYFTPHTSQSASTNTHDHMLSFLTSLLTPDPARCSEARSELELAPSELMSALSPLDSRLVWMASRSSSFTMGVKLVKSSRVSVPGGERQGTRAEQLMSASEGPECCSIILETQESTDYYKFSQSHRDF